jgi:hypothetical protein
LRIVPRAQPLRRDSFAASLTVPTSRCCSKRKSRLGRATPKSSCGWAPEGGPVGGPAAMRLGVGGSWSTVTGDAELVDTVGEEIDCGDGDHDRDDRGESGVEPVTLMGFHYFGRRGVPGRSGVGFSGRPMWSWWRRSARGESRATAPTRMGPCGAGRVNPATNRRLSGVPSRMVIEGQLLSSGD